jgi:hypothetical protein
LKNTLEKGVYARNLPRRIDGGKRGLVAAHVVCSSGRIDRLAADGYKFMTGYSAGI